MAFGEKFGNFVTECVRVFRITRKPTKEEYRTIMKVSALGILIIGFIGGIMHFVDRLAGLIVATAVFVVLILLLMFWGKKQVQ